MPDFINVRYEDYKTKVTASFNTDLTARQRKTFGNRLLKLAAYLQKLAPNQYYHESLVERIVGGKPAKTDCGTVACAFGHAIVSGKFRNINAFAKFKLGKNGVCDTNAGGKISYRVKDRKKLFNDLKSAGIFSSYVDKPKDLCITDMEPPANAYFGPGSWDAIFDTYAYGEDSPKRKQVVNRIRYIARKCYGVKP